MECPECRVRHPRACGEKTFLKGRCPICLELNCCPFVLLPCSHGLCEEDFSRMGGLLGGQIPSAPQETPPPFAPQETPPRTNANAVEYMDTDGRLVLEYV